jgi:hypothetical protein
MLKYTLFYIFFTAFTLAAAWFYCDKQKTEAEVFAMRTDVTRGESLRILDRGKYSNRETINERTYSSLGNDNSDLVVKISNEMDSFRKKYRTYQDSLSALNQRKFKIEADNPQYFYSKERLYKKDIQAYSAWRNDFKKYCKDSIFENNIFNFIKNKTINLDIIHESNIQYFCTNFNEYTATEQHEWLNIDELYWRRKISDFTDILIDNLVEKEYQAKKKAKSSGLKMVMIPDKIPERGKPFTATIGLAEFATNKTNIKYTINGQDFKPENGEVYFDLPAGKADKKNKVLEITATITNPVTQQSNTVKGEIQYKVSK